MIRALLANRYYPFVNTCPWPLFHTWVKQEENGRVSSQAWIAYWNPNIAMD